LRTQISAEEQLEALRQQNKHLLGKQQEHSPKPGRVKSEKRSRSQLVVVDQWIEVVRSPNGQTSTTLYPANTLLREKVEQLDPHKDLVYRRFHFVSGVPDEYAWTTADPGIRATGGVGIQRMTVATWLDQIERERTSGTGHLLPCGGNLPRPQERGGCDCAVCTHNRDA